jgi:hypothetical protein
MARAVFSSSSIRRILAIGESPFPSRGKILAKSRNSEKANDFKFDLIRSKGLANFPTVAPNAHGLVKIESVGPVEIMKVTVWGLPPNTDFDFFVIQVPNAPFEHISLASNWSGGHRNERSGPPVEFIAFTKIERNPETLRSASMLQTRAS